MTPACRIICAVLAIEWVVFASSIQLVAADDLPDPLKPSWPKSAAASVGVSSDINFSGSHESPLYPRDMAIRVVGALDSLCRLVADNLDRIRKTEEAIDKLKREISQLEWDKLIKLNEFRRGEFCSGCNQTRSQILAKGEQFPHAGQQIVLPTKEQIEAKEKELEEPIASRRKELPGLQEIIDQLTAVNREALSQIHEGIRLWRTSVTFEHNLILQVADSDFRAAREEKQKIESKLSQLRRAQTRTGDIEALKLLKKDETLWQGLLEKWQVQQTQRQQRVKQSILRAREDKLAEFRRISGFLDRIQPHWMQPQDAMNYKPMSWSDADYNLGREFKFGQLKTRGARFDSDESVTLTRVKLFIGRFQATRPAVSVSEATGALMSEGDARQDELLLMQNAAPTRKPSTPQPSKNNNDLPLP